MANINLAAGHAQFNRSPILRSLRPLFNVNEDSEYESASAFDAISNPESTVSTVSGWSPGDPTTYRGDCVLLVQLPLRNNIAVQYHTTRY